MQVVMSFWKGFLKMNGLFASIQSRSLQKRDGKKYLMHLFLTEGTETERERQYAQGKNQKGMLSFSHHFLSSLVWAQMRGEWCNFPSL